MMASRIRSWRGGVFLRLHLNDVELLRAIKAEQQRAPLEDPHYQQPSLGVRVLDRSGEERLQQRVQPRQIKRGVTPSRVVDDLRQRSIERCIHLADGAT